MTVEFALLIPVAIVVGLIAVNLMRFSALCARFDRMAVDAVVTQGVSPEGQQSVESAVTKVRESLERSLGSAACAMRVRVEDVADADGPSSVGEGVELALSAGSVRFVCELSYVPWPLHVGFKRVPYGAPGSLRHEKSLVVDRYRPGVVM